jgi:hypothetical protein
MPMYGGGFKRNWSLVQSLSVCLRKYAHIQSEQTVQPRQHARFPTRRKPECEKNKMHLNCIERCLTQHDGVQETIRQFISR